MTIKNIKDMGTNSVVTLISHQINMSWLSSSSLLCGLMVFIVTIIAAYNQVVSPWLLRGNISLFHLYVENSYSFAQYNVGLVSLWKCSVCYY